MSNCQVGGVHEPKAVPPTCNSTTQQHLYYCERCLYIVIPWTNSNLATLLSMV